MFESKLQTKEKLIINWYILLHIFKITACVVEVDSRVKKSITGMQSDDK